MKWPSFPAWRPSDGTAQARRLDAHDRIDLRIELGVSSQHLDTNGVGLDPVALALQDGLNDEAQKGPKLDRAAEYVANDHALDLRTDLVSGRDSEWRFDLKLHLMKAKSMPSQQRQAGNAKPMGRGRLLTTS